MMRVLTWNMGHWHYTSQAPAAWARLWSENTDIALLQEAAPGDGLASDVHLLPAPPWVIGEHRRWGSGIISRWPISSIPDVRTIYGKHRFAIVEDNYYRGSMAVGMVEPPGLGRVAVISLYALMEPYYAQTTMFRAVADLIPLFDSREFDHYMLGGDLNVHTQVPLKSRELPRYAAILDAVESLGLLNLLGAA
jgi:hypothetical protein